MARSPTIVVVKPPARNPRRLDSGIATGEDSATSAATEVHPMAALNLRFLDAARRPLDDQVDVDVTRLRTNERVVRVRNHEGRKKLSIKDLVPGETYVVRSFPMRHRPVSQFAM